MKCIKRILLFFLSVCIIGITVITDYQEVKAVDIPTAFWGTMEASRSWFTAMRVGGAFDRGISFNDFILTDDIDWIHLYARVYEAYQLFCVYKERLRLKSENPSISDSDLNTQSVENGRRIAQDFKEKAIDVSTTTKDGITVEDFKYWQEFCKGFSSVAKNGLGSGTIGPDTVITVPINNPYNIQFSSQALTNIGANTFVYNDKYFITKGMFNGNEYNITDVPTDRVRIPYVNVVGSLQSSNVYCYLYLLDVYRLTGEIITVSTRAENYYNSSFSSIADLIHGNTSFPTMFGGSGNQISDWRNDYMNTMSVSSGGQAALDWQYAVQNSLDENEAGTAIKEGNAKQSTKSVVRDGSVPVKRSSLREEERNGEKVISGAIGWDIPGTEVITAPIVDDTKEDEFIEDIGVIDVPEDVVISDPVPGEIVIPGEEEVVIPVTPDIPMPISKIFEIQSGPFYPTAMGGLEEFFPFCIPFDIIYLFNKFRAPEQAPVITIPIMYGSGLAAAIGTDRYEVVIDFNDFVILRDIIRVFSLIGFLIGLMQITRNLIRG